MDSALPPAIAFKIQWYLASVNSLITLTEAYSGQGDALAGFLQQIILSS